MYIDFLIFFSNCPQISSAITLPIAYTPSQAVHFYIRLGWKVIVYDRFGFHREFLEDLINLPGFDYHPYTLFQIVNPSKYTSEYAQNQGFGYKIYYSMEKNWGYGKSTNGKIMIFGALLIGDSCLMSSWSYYV